MRMCIRSCKLEQELRVGLQCCLEQDHEIAQRRQQDTHQQGMKHADETAKQKAKDMKLAAAAKPKLGAGNKPNGKGK